VVRKWITVQTDTSRYASRAGLIASAEHGRGSLLIEENHHGPLQPQGNSYVRGGPKENASGDVLYFHNDWLSLAGQTVQVPTGRETELNMSSERY